MELFFCQRQMQLIDLSRAKYAWLNVNVFCSYQNLAFNFGEPCSWEMREKNDSMIILLFPSPMSVSNQSCKRGFGKYGWISRSISRILGKVCSTFTFKGFSLIQKFRYRRRIMYSHYIPGDKVIAQNVLEKTGFLWKWLVVDKETFLANLLVKFWPTGTILALGGGGKKEMLFSLIKFFHS